MYLGSIVYASTLQPYASVPQAADAAALERLPHVPMPLDEARLGIGVGLELLTRPEGHEMLGMSRCTQANSLPNRTLARNTNLNPNPDWP